MPCWGWITVAAVAGLMLGAGAVLGLMVLFAEGMSDE